MRTLLLLLLLAVVCLFGWMIAQSQNDQDAPVVSASLYHLGDSVESFDNNAWRLPANDPFTLRLQSNEATEFSLNYSGQTYNKVARKFEIALDAVAGQNTVEVVAEDRNGNQETYLYSLAGLPSVTPLVQTPPEVLPGDPFTINIALPPQIYGVNASNLEVSLLDESLTVFDHSFNSATQASAVAVIPLGRGIGEYPIEVTMTDTFGRITNTRQVIRLLGKSQSPQIIELPPDLLAIRNAENQFKEATVVEAAFETSTNKATPLWTEAFIQPVEGPISSGFGIPRLYGIGGEQSFHSGTDVIAAEGTAIRATNDGVVSVSGYYPIKGGFIMIDHGGGVQSLYFHQPAGLLVREGQVVNRGDLIGKVGSTGLSTGPHLHWEIRINNQPTDVAKWIDKKLP